jgi:hypothetical protein
MRRALTMQLVHNLHHVASLGRCGAEGYFGHAASKISPSGPPRKAIAVWATDAAGNEQRFAQKSSEHPADLTARPLSSCISEAPISAH